MRRLLATVFLFAFVACDSDPNGTTSQFDDATVEALSSALEAQRADLDLAGAIVGVWMGDDEWTHTLGHVDRARSAPMSTDLHFRIGSVTKTFTGELILRLVDEGVLSLDDTVDMYLPDAPRASEVTIRHLGRMESGYATYTFDPDFQAALFAGGNITWRPMDVIQIGWDNTAAECPIVPGYCFDPGTDFAYNNTNLAMLGLIAEQETGTPLRDLFRTYLLTPAGMSNTLMPTNASLPSPYPRGYSTQGLAEGSREVHDVTDWNPTWGYGTGDMVSTLADLRIWAEIIGSGSGLSAAMRAERFRESRFPPNQPGRAYSFALGVKDGFWGHTGSTTGYTTTVKHNPDRGVTLVVLTNGDQHYRRDTSDERPYTPSDVLADAVLEILKPEGGW
ncbi:MAG: beta-lactamase family protein [Rhodothermales bacterium]|nr:beta-lactamase family protein [Rhodothermales bacterium]MBO6779419.1 beta-lactamase family protein [Rhodothermales bacterium]